jgi:hypothetical protein
VGAATNRINGASRSMLVVVKQQDSPGRGKVWRVIVFIDGVRLLRPGFQKKKAALSLAAMLVQQGLIHGWNVTWQVTDEDGKPSDMNLAALGNKMKRGEAKHQKET